MPAKSAHDSCDFSEATELDAGNAGTYAVRLVAPLCVLQDTCFLVL